jgi:hypothetical protein
MHISLQENLKAKELLLQSVELWCADARAPGSSNDDQETDDDADDVDDTGAQEAPEPTNNGGHLTVMDITAQTTATSASVCLSLWLWITFISRKRWVYV